MNKRSRTVYFNLDISHDDCLQYYQGHIQYVMVTTEDHINIQLPAQFIHKFVGQDGVHGRFRLEYDENNKLVSLVREDKRGDRL